MFEKSVFENLKSTRDRAYQAVRFAREEKDRSGKELSKIREKLNAQKTRKTKSGT